MLIVMPHACRLLSRSSYSNNGPTWQELRGRDLGNLASRRCCSATVPQPSSRASIPLEHILPLHDGSHCLQSKFSSECTCLQSTGLLKIWCVHRELQYVLEDAQVKVVLTAPEFQAQMQPLAQAVGASLHVMGQELADSHQAWACCHILSCGALTSAIVQRLLLKRHWEALISVVHFAGTPERPQKRTGNARCAQFSRSRHSVHQWDNWQAQR